MSELVEQLKKEKGRLLGLINSIDNLLKEYGQMTIIEQQPTTVPQSNKQNAPILKDVPQVGKKGLSLKESVKNAVLTFDRFKKGNEAVAILSEWYPEKKSNKLNFQVQVSGLLSDWGKTGEIVKFQFSPSKKDTVWGRPEWLDENGKPKEGYEPITE